MGPRLPEYHDLKIDIPNPPPVGPQPITLPQVLQFRPAATDAETGQVAGSSDDDVAKGALKIIEWVAGAGGTIAEGVGKISEGAAAGWQAIEDSPEAPGVGGKPPNIADTIKAIGDLVKWANADATGEGIIQVGEALGTKEGKELITNAVVRQSVGRLPGIGKPIKAALKGQSRAQIVQGMEDDLAQLAEDAGIDGIAEYASGEVPDLYEEPYTEEEKEVARQAIETGLATAARIHGQGGFIWGRRTPTQMAKMLALQFRHYAESQDEKYRRMFEGEEIEPTYPSNSESLRMVQPPKKED